MKQSGSVSAEQATEICGCSIKEVEQYRRNVLPRPPGAVPDPKLFEREGGCSNRGRSHPAFVALQKDRTSLCGSSRAGSLVRS